MKQIEDDMTPFGFIDDGVNNTENQSYIDNTGQSWEVVDNEDSSWF